jgi:large subunit ribosomal protein L29
MKAQEVHNMSDEELNVEQDQLRRRLYDLKAQAVTEKLENPRELGNLKRDIARLLTEQRQRQLKQEDNE